MAKQHAFKHTSYCQERGEDALPGTAGPTLPKEHNSAALVTSAGFSPSSFQQFLLIRYQHTDRIMQTQAYLSTSQCWAS